MDFKLLDTDGLPNNDDLKELDYKDLLNKSIIDRSEVISRPPVAISLGNYEYIPNKEAALELINWFSDKALQSFRLILVGRNPAKEMLVKAKNSSNIRITGEVDNVYSIQNRARVFVSPLRTGGGMKNKILQALSSGIKVIGTEESFSGLDKSLFNLVTCETKEEFIKAITQSLSKDFKLDENNINAVRKNHYWKSTVKNAIFKSNS